MKNKKILYVNYAPYENQGKILDFLISEYRYVFLISIGHHSLGKKRITNKLTVYKNGKKINESFFFLLSVPSRLIFVLLPIRSVISMFQLVIHAYQLNKVYGAIDYYFTPNGFTAWVGLLLRRLGLVDKTIYWVCDYYPIKHKDKIIQAMRWLYWQFEKHTVSSDLLAFHNTRLIDKWKEEGLCFGQSKTVLVPIGTSKEKLHRKKPSELILCFLGVLKRSQGVDFIIDSANLIAKEFPNVTIHIIGPGPDRKYFKRKARLKKANIIFHGYVSEKEMDAIISSSNIGLALYVPDPSNVSYYGDPGKIKKYLSHGLPVIATNIHEFTQELKEKKAGILIDYGNKKQLLEALQRLLLQYGKYQKNVITLRDAYYYRYVYKKMFKI
jgi:glycosyltransferase involved in cell wall biosynthesis